MKSYANLRKQNSGIFTVMTALVLCVVVSASVLFSRLMDYQSEDSTQYIPLTESAGTTRITTTCQDVRTERTSPVFFSLSIPGKSMMNAKAEHGFKAYDEDTVWTGETDVEIFKVSYENGDQVVTVNSSRGDKVIAPGTSNVYAFALENTGNVSLNYEMTMEAYFSNGEYQIPVDARVYDYQGNYLAGSADGMADVLELNKVKQTGILSAGRVAPYTLEWEWPFEEDDEYDTLLGNMTADEDISLTIVIKTVATCDQEHTEDSGLVKTGDTTNMTLMVTMLVASLAGIMFLLLLLRHRREEDE